jgi:hypothetical protein
MKKVFLSFLSFCLVFCLLLAGCATPSQDPSRKHNHLIGNVKNASKITEDFEAGTIAITQKNVETDAPSFVFYDNQEPLAGAAWAVTGTINMQTVSGKSGHSCFIAKSDTSNVVNIIINRRVAGVNGIYRNIVQDGVRTPATGNKNISDNLADTTDWTAEFAFVYYEGGISMYLKEAEEEFQLMTYYAAGWDNCTAEFSVAQNTDVVLSKLDMTNDSAKVKELRDKLEGIPENPIDSPKVLFIGNSATFVNDIPQTLSRLARKAGYNVEANDVTLGGATLTQHADATTDHGKKVLNAIVNGGYDIVFLQDNGNCISSDAMRAASQNACRTLDTAIRAAGAKTYIYVRPPYGYDNFGYTPFEQCAEFDMLFDDIAAELGAKNVYVNRAFAYAIQNLNVSLWGPDNAHTSEEGAYLAVCVFFSTLFQTTSTVLDHNGLPADVAVSLQQVADKIVLEHFIPR